LGEALARQRKTGEPLGFILLQMGYVKGEVLAKALERQIFETTSKIFRWKEGRYRFSSQRIPLSRGYSIDPIPIENLLLEGMRMVDEWPLIEREIPSLDRLLVKTPRSSEREELKDMDEDGRRILDLVDRSKSVQEIINASHLSDFDTCKILAGLVSSGILEVKASSGDVPEGQQPLALSSRRSLQLALAFLFSLVTLAFVLVNIFLLHSANSNLIPFAPSGERKATLAKVFMAKSEIKGWSEATRQFYAERGSWPSNLKELRLEGRGRELKEKDPWGSPYQFQSTKTAAVIMSSGEDGIKRSDDDIVERLLL
jgi:hypothetical protein